MEPVMFLWWTLAVLVALGGVAVLAMLLSFASRLMDARVDMMTARVAQMRALAARSSSVRSRRKARDDDDDDDDEGIVVPAWLVGLAEGAGVDMDKLAAGD